MIHLLASLFRGLSFIFGISAPPPEQNQRSFVFMWLGIVAFLAIFLAALLWVMLQVRIR